MSGQNHVMSFVHIDSTFPYWFYIPSPFLIVNPPWNCQCTMLGQSQPKKRQPPTQSQYSHDYWLFASSISPSNGPIPRKNPNVPNKKVTIKWQSTHCISIPWLVIYEHRPISIDMICIDSHPSGFRNLDASILFGFCRFWWSSSDPALRHLDEALLASAIIARCFAVCVPTASSTCEDGRWTGW